MIRPVQFAIFALLTACGAAAPAADPVPPRGEASPVAIAGDTLILPAAVPDHFRLLDSATVDVDGDGATERVDLAAVLGVDDEGRFQWDDGQEWLVAVRDGADTYPLLREHLHSGSAAFWIMHVDSAGPPAILVLTDWLNYPGGGIRIQEFVFDRSRGGYVRTNSIGGPGSIDQYRGPPESGYFLQPTIRPKPDPDNPPDR
jgi:hypothetical protein